MPQSRHKNTPNLVKGDDISFLVMFFVILANSGRMRMARQRHAAKVFLNKQQGFHFLAIFRLKFSKVKVLEKCEELLVGSENELASPPKLCVELLNEITPASRRMFCTQPQDNDTLLSSDFTTVR